MSADDAIRVEALSRGALRDWLEVHHETCRRAWLITWKKHSDYYLSYGELIEELLCWGWIDSRSKGVDGDRTSVLIAPRNPKSAWSAVNKAKVEAARASGAMTPAGEALIAVARGNGMWAFLDDVERLEVPPDLAPGDQGPDLAPEPQAQWPDRAAGVNACFVSIVQDQPGAAFGGAFQPVQKFARRQIGSGKRHSVDLDRRRAVAGIGGQDRADLFQSLFGGKRHIGTAPGADHARAGGQGHNFVAGEHQRRHLPTGAHDISDASLAIDRHPGTDKVGDVAVNRALRDFQPFGQPPRRGQTPAAQVLDNLKQTVGAAHWGWS